MPHKHLYHHLPHAPDALLDLVVDVERYHEFIPLISNLRILRQDTISETQSQFEAEVLVGYKMIRERFRSVVDVNRENMTVSVKKSNDGGAVRQLSNNWRFYALEDGSTLIDFSIDVTLKSRTLEFLVRQKFDKATQFLIQKFEARAKQICPVIGAPQDPKIAAQSLGLS